MPTHADPLPERSELHRWVWRWHGYAGLFVIPFIFFMALTGIPYVWEHELEDAFHPEYRALTPQPTRVSYQQQLATARAACPEKQFGFIKVDGDPRHATQFWFDEGSNPTSVFINPYDGSVITKMNEWTRLSYAAIALHGLIFIEPYGSWLLELLACWGIVLCATGVYLWWPRGGGKVWGVFLPRLRSEGRTRWRDIHAVGGFYFAAVLAFYLMTGLPWTAFWGGKLLTGIQDATGQTYPHCMTGESSHASIPPSPEARPLPLDAFVEFGLALKLPGHHLEIELPTAPTGTVHLRNRADSSLHEQHYQLDVFTAKPVAAIHWADVPVTQKAVMLGIDLHEGHLLGRPTQIAATVLACLFMLLAGAAAAMWWKRRPQGRPDWPRRIERVALPLPLRIAIVVAAVLMPLAGLSMLALGIAGRLRSNAT